MRTVTLPKLVEADTRADRVRHALAERTELLWPEGKLHVSCVPLSVPLAHALKRAAQAGHVVRGLEAAERTLAAEERGQRMADEQRAAPRGVRVSRLLLITNDGAERFYRGVEALLRRHGERALALRVEASAEELGAMLFGPAGRARLLLLEHKDAVAAALLALAAE